MASQALPDQVAPRDTLLLLLQEGLHVRDEGAFLAVIVRKDNKMLQSFRRETIGENIGAVLSWKRRGKESNQFRGDKLG